MGATERDHPRPAEPTHAPASRGSSWWGLLLASLVAWPVIYVPALLGWRHGERTQAAASGFGGLLDPEFYGLLGLGLGAVLLVPLWFLVRRWVPLRRTWPALCAVLAVLALPLFNWRFEPSSAVMAGLPVLAACLVATAICARRASTLGRVLLPVLLIAVLAVVMALDTRAVHRRYHAERLAAWQAAGSTFWMPAEAEMPHINSCYVAEGRTNWLWLPSDGALGIQAEQSATSGAPASPRVTSKSPLTVVVVEKGGQQVRLEAAGDDITASKLLSLAEDLRPVDPEWMVARCG